jgi:hypothetical protein
MRFAVTPSRHAIAACPSSWATLGDLESGALLTGLGKAGVYDVRLDDIPVRYCLLVEGESDDGDFVWD